jgi:N-acetylglucosamine kinase-like BadF-type ATPase
MKKRALIIMVLVSVYTHCSTDYILCIDGGGSKTALQIVDAQGALLPLTKRGVTTDKIEVAGSNINAIGFDRVKLALHELIDDITIENDKVLRDILPTCYVVAGMAGIGAGANRVLLLKLFKELGIQKDHLILTSDAALALDLVHGSGAILIAGTGSICLGKKEDKRYRVGGLGYLLGDEGSGYAIGLQALKVALAYEYGWGKPTSLTEQLCKLYDVSELKDVMQILYEGKMKLVQKISQAAPIVVAQALIKDDQAVAIIDSAATQLSDLVATMVMVGDLFDCEVHLWGGLFKSDVADIFIKTIEQHPFIQQRHIKLVNQAWQNATTLFVQQNICKYGGIINFMQTAYQG